jgi:hypothetical protein
MGLGEEHTDGLIPGHLSRDAAMDDHESVVACGARCGVPLVVSKDLEGELSIE